MVEREHYVWNLAGGHNLAQGIFEELIESALLYQFRGLRRLFVPIGPVTINDAIFTLNSHDEVPIRGRNLVVNGQKLKELFVTLIFARALQHLARYKGKAMFMTLPLTNDHPADTGIFSVDMDGFHYDKDGCIVMNKETEAAHFQVKEYVDLEQAGGLELITAKTLAPEKFHIEKLEQYDQEILLIYIRAMATFNTRELKTIFEKLRGKKVYIIAPFIIDLKQDNGTVIKPKGGGTYNFIIIDVLADSDLLIHVWFTDPPRIRTHTSV